MDGKELCHDREKNCSAWLSVIWRSISRRSLNDDKTSKIENTGICWYIEESCIIRIDLPY